MKQHYLMRTQVETVEHQLVDYAILEAKEGSLKLITSGSKGTIIGGLFLLGISSIYYGLLATPFLIFHAPPIQLWGIGPMVLFAIAIPIGFIVIIFRGLRLIESIQIRYPKTTRSVEVVDVRPGKLRHEVTVRSNGVTYLLTITGRRSSIIDAMAKARGLPSTETF